MKVRTPVPSPVQRKTGLVLLAGLGVFWLYAGLITALNPGDALIPDDDYRQYIAGWPSGSGTREVTAFLREQAAKPGLPLLVSVGGFGRHGAWVIRPALAKEKNISFREGFIDTPEALAELGRLARDYRVLIVEEPPVYELPKSVLTLAARPPKAVFSFDRVIPRLGVTDGALRVLEVSRHMRVRVPFPAGAPVPPDAPPLMESIANPNGMEGTPDAPFFWIGEGATTLIVRSGQAGVLRIEGTLRAGPSVSGKPTRSLLITTSGGEEQAMELGSGPAVFQVPIGAGRTRIQLTALDRKQVEKLPSGDARPLMIGVENLRITGLSQGPPPLAHCAASMGGNAYPAERQLPGNGWFRWTADSMEMALFSSRAGRVAIQAEYLSSIRPARIAVEYEGASIATIPVAASQDKLQPLPPFAIEVPAGASTIVFRTDRPGVKPAGDARALSFLIANPQAHLVPGPSCEVRQ